MTPTPGHIVAVNALTLTTGGCTGNLTIYYRQLVVDNAAQLAIDPLTSCSIRLTYAALNGPGAAFGLYGQFEVHAADRWSFLDPFTNQWQSVGLFSNVTFGRSAVSCPTKLLAQNTPQNTHGWALDPIPHDDTGFQGCGYYSGAVWEKSHTASNSDFLELGAWSTGDGGFGCEWKGSYWSGAAEGCRWLPSGVDLTPGALVDLGTIPNDGAPHDLDVHG